MSNLNISFGACLASCAFSKYTGLNRSSLLLDGDHFLGGLRWFLILWQCSFQITFGQVLRVLCSLFLLLDDFFGLLHRYILVSILLLLLLFFSIFPGHRLLLLHLYRPSLGQLPLANSFYLGCKRIRRASLLLLWLSCLLLLLLQLMTVDLVQELVEIWWHHLGLLHWDLDLISESGFQIVVHFIGMRLEEFFFTD